jgi:hypothetical protein
MALRLALNDSPFEKNFPTGATPLRTHKTLLQHNRLAMTGH